MHLVLLGASDVRPCLPPLLHTFQNLVVRCSCTADENGSTCSRTQTIQALPVGIPSSARPNVDKEILYMTNPFLKESENQEWLEAFATIRKRSFDAMLELSGKD